MGGPALAVVKESGIGQLADPRPWYKIKRLWILNGWILLLLITSSTSGYDGSMMNGLLSLDVFRQDFGNPTGGTLGLFNAIQNIGSVAGLPFAPMLTDWGRKRAIFIGASIMVIAAAVQASAQSLGMFIGARFMVGFGLQLAGNAAPLLVTEIAYPTLRAPLTSCYNSIWFTGAIIAAWTTFGTFFIKNSWAWRIPSAIQGFPALLQVLLIWFVPQSPRWLINKGREDEARKMLGYWHGFGDEQHPIVDFQMKEIKASIEFEKSVQKDVGYKTLFTTPGNRRRMRIIMALALFSQWSGTGIVSYYLHVVFDLIGITNTTIQLLINGVLQIWNFACALAGAFLCDRAGRRTLFIGSCIGMLIFWLAQTICFAQTTITGSQAAAHGVIAFIFLFNGAYDVAFSPLIVSYTVEILPYNIRAKGYNVFGLTLLLALIFNQYINPIALAAIGWKYYLVYVFWIAFELVYCYLFVVETKNLTLEETSVLFDGAEGVEKVTSLAIGRTDDTTHRRESSTEKEKGGSVEVVELV
ncbi:hypothetical protein M422DRAFT_244216 [Sphaerobolus stellatus SS14]|nr:hypothetical protein M422DRAFT_244216 [Sphaerobolus stellatus SS14]